MKLRRFMAGALAATLVAGSSMVAFADDTANTGSATGTGTSVGHVDKEVLSVTLPTSTDNVFNYWVDTERVIDLAGSLIDGTSITKNNDGVYFKQSDDSYASSSEEVEFEGKNSVAVDVSVAATVEATGDKDITLVADDDALAAATTPALLMNLTVGSDTKAITSNGATAKAQLDGKENNFEVKVQGGAYKYVPKDTPTDAWAKTTVKLSGKTNNMDVPSDMTAPKINLTWTITKHVEYTDITSTHGSWSGGKLWLAKDAKTGFSTTGLTVEVSDGGTTYQTLSPDKYSVNDAGWISTTWDNIVAGIGSTPQGKAFVRITDGNTRYIFENK